MLKNISHGRALKPARQLNAFLNCFKLAFLTYGKCQCSNPAFIPNYWLKPLPMKDLDALTTTINGLKYFWLVRLSFEKEQILEITHVYSLRASKHVLFDTESYRQNLDVFSYKIHDSRAKGFVILMKFYSAITVAVTLAENNKIK